MHDDADWLREGVARLTQLHQGHREQPWSLDDAPARYVAGQLRAIVGIELSIERVEAKAKLSQNRPAEGRAGVIDGLRREGRPGSREMSEVMARQVERSRSAPQG